MIRQGSILEGLGCGKISIDHVFVPSCSNSTTRVFNSKAFRSTDHFPIVSDVWLPLKSVHGESIPTAAPFGTVFCGGATSNERQERNQASLTAWRPHADAIDSFKTQVLEAMVGSVSPVHDEVASRTSTLNALVKQL